MVIANIGAVGRLGLTRGTGVGPAAYAHSPAPAGFRWAFVTDRGVRVTAAGVPVVDLVRVA